MSDTIQRMMEFNGNKIAILVQDGSWWVAIRPICDALSLEWENERRRISRNPILSSIAEKKEVLAGDNRLREMLCLPEKYVYGWLFSINSDNEALIAYQRECYDALYAYFHGAITNRISVLQLRDDTEREMADLERKLEQERLQSEAYKRLQELKNSKKKIDTSLKEIDKKLLSGQIAINFGDQ